MTHFCDLTAAEQGRGIAAGEIDPVELTQGYLDRIAGHVMADRIYARLTPERAIDEAKAARARAQAGRRVSPLDGVPISWKDLFDTAGTGTEAGSALLKGRVPDHDAEVLQTATAMGLVCLGKTHMSELAFSGLGLNPITATSPCVNDTDAVSGGSSSGAAASVAFGLASIGIGSDTGGSVRIPSVWNDLVGLKTTSGRLSLRGVVPLAAKFDTVGPLCRSVEDAALMLAALEGRTSPDLRGSGDLRGRRIGALQTVVMEDLRDAPAAAYTSAIDRMKQAGARVDPFEFPMLEAAMADAGKLYTAEAWATWGQAIQEQPDAMFGPIRTRFEIGKSVAASDYIAAWQRLEQMRAAWEQAIAGYDMIICPTAPNVAPSQARLLEDDSYYATENLLTLRNTRVGNLTGGCSMTVPTGVPSCGVMLIAPAWQEDRLLRIGACVEAALA